jgi:RNA polymerase sigma-70 factor, ECF subfamily
MAIELIWGGAAADVEDRLAVRCRTGEAAAFDEIVTRYQVRLFRFAYRLLRDRAEAEDAVQETFVRAYRALPAYRPDGFFSSWIYRIALNECRRRIRSRRATVGLEFAVTAASGPDPQSLALASERNHILRQAVDALPEHYRLVMVLFYFEELSVDQIARTLEVSVSAVKVRLHRGRERLATRLEYSP